MSLSGRVSWDEYKVKFLVSKGHSEKEVAAALQSKQGLQVDEESECTGRAGSDGSGHPCSAHCHARCAFVSCETVCQCCHPY